MKFKILVYNYKDEEFVNPKGNFPIGYCENQHLEIEQYRGRSYYSQIAKIDDKGEPYIDTQLEYEPPPASWSKEAEFTIRLNKSSWERTIKTGDWYIDLNSLEELANLLKVNEGSSVEFNEHVNYIYFD